MWHKSWSFYHRTWLPKLQTAKHSTRKPKRWKPMMWKVANDEKIWEVITYFTELYDWIGSYWYLNYLKPWLPDCFRSFLTKSYELLGIDVRAKFWKWPPLWSLAGCRPGKRSYHPREHQRRSWWFGFLPCLLETWEDWEEDVVEIKQAYQAQTHIHVLHRHIISCEGDKSSELQCH